MAKCVCVCVFECRFKCEAKWECVYLVKGVNGACRGMCVSVRARVCYLVPQSHMGWRLSVGLATEKTSWFMPPHRKSHGRAVLALPIRRAFQPLRGQNQSWPACWAPFYLLSVAVCGIPFCSNAASWWWRRHDGNADEKSIWLIIPDFQCHRL